MTPESDSIPGGYCNAFTVTLLGAAGADIAGQTIDIEVRDSDSGPDQDPQTAVRFCTPDLEARPSNYNQSGPNVRPSQTVLNNSLNGDAPCEGAPFSAGCDGTLSGETGTTDSGGQITFGVISNDSGTYQVLAYHDTNDNDVLETWEPADSSFKTFTGFHEPQCMDGADNDGDGRIDFDDSGCESGSDNDETGPLQYRVYTPVTLRYDRSVHAFKGTVSSTRKRCRVNREIGLIRQRSGRQDRVVERVRTNDKGRFIIKRHLVAGKDWHVRAWEKRFDPPGDIPVICLTARSTTIEL
jgi:hypothetical protein